jgi:hypothetical protein
MPAYFHDKFAEASGMPPASARAAGPIRFVRRDTPLLGPIAWSRADVYFRQQLAPAFLAQWERDGSDAQGEVATRAPRR